MFEFQKLPNGDFEKIVNLCMCSVMITDSDAKIVYVNEYFSETTGYSSEEVIGQNPNILRSGEMPDEYYKELWETITQGKEWNGELLNKDKNGVYFWEFARILPIHDIDGNQFYIGVKQNITRVKELEEKLVGLYDKAIACVKNSP
ncbi:hypothetical protein LCGC14_1224920 [marine sediment metagenome]|uniref:PAS domain-containing protein n=1 Tax=marine sediment metagenome TaxID=412755 RepID=A0A0F9LXF7_9ZZZZ